MNGGNERLIVPSGRRLVSEARLIVSVYTRSDSRRVLAHCHKRASAKWLHQNNPAPLGSGLEIACPANTDHRPAMKNLSSGLKRSVHRPYQVCHAF
jgi:hypothetical protein